MLLGFLIVFSLLDISKGPILFKRHVDEDARCKVYSRSR